MEFSKSGNVNTGKKLLSECVKKFSLEVDNEMSRILVDWVAMNKLKKGVNDSLSFEGLKYFLIKTFDTKKPFATPEIEIWEYILARAKKDQQGVQQYLSKLADYINLNRIDAEEIKNRIELFNIYSDKKLKEVYFSMAVGKGLELIRGVPIFKWKIGRSGLKVFDGGFTVEADEGVRPKSILGDLIFQGRGVYEWNILIDKMYNHIYIGICDIHENLNNNFFLTDFSFNYRHGWVLGSDGYVYHKTQHKWYDAKFKEGDKVTVRLDMKERTCAFSVNDIRKPIVSEWKNIPSQVYPVVSLGHGSKLRVKQELI
ncbi:unnamed protein product [Rhizophagus irregularis]|nr:unnamed protein product [Rhizophagus irregularis]